MKKNNHHIIYQKFIKQLDSYKKKGCIKILHRGVSLKFAFDRFNLDRKYNSIEQFAEKLFFYGEKSKYFWEQKMSRKFTINDISENVFEYIFKSFNRIALEENSKKGTINYRNRNKKLFIFFSKMDNLKYFLKKINLLCPNEKKQIRNYYFRIIHQLGETNYKKSSLIVSGTTSKKEAKKFSKEGIIINFWDFDFNNFPFAQTNIPLFKGKPYKNQKEISILAAIFPHYIYSFEYNNKFYYNPALFTKTDLDKMILFGFDINQTNFEQKLPNETSYEKGVFREDQKLREIKT